MTNTEKLLRDIEDLRDSIEIEWDELASNPLREEERENIRLHIERCQAELQTLLQRVSTGSVNDAR
jgi:hypothetical protein